MNQTRNKLAAGMAVVTLAGGILAGTPNVAHADGACTGANETHLVRADPMTGGETWEFKADSCQSQAMVDDLGNAKDASGFASMVAGKVPAVAWGAPMVFGWAWVNQNALRDCTAPGTGTTFTAVNGIITKCQPQ